MTVGGAVPEGSMTKTEAPASLMDASPMSATVIPWTRGSEARRSVVSLAIEKLVLPTTTSPGKAVATWVRVQPIDPTDEHCGGRDDRRRGGSPRWPRARWPSGHPAERKRSGYRVRRSSARRHGASQRDAVSGLGVLHVRSTGGRPHGARPPPPPVRRGWRRDRRRSGAGSSRDRAGASADPDRVATRRARWRRRPRGHFGHGHGQGPDPGDQTDLEARRDRAHAVLGRVPVSVALLGTEEQGDRGRAAKGDPDAEDEQTRRLEADRRRERSSGALRQIRSAEPKRSTSGGSIAATAALKSLTVVDPLSLDGVGGPEVEVLGVVGPSPRCPERSRSCWRTDCSRPVTTARPKRSRTARG